MKLARPKKEIFPLVDYLLNSGSLNKGVKNG